MTDFPLGQFHVAGTGRVACTTVKGYHLVHLLLAAGLVPPDEVLAAATWLAEAGWDLTPSNRLCYGPVVLTRDYVTGAWGALDGPLLSGDLMAAARLVVQLVDG